MEITQIFTALGLLITIVTSYVVTTNKRVRFETETKMKFLEMERRLNEHVTANKDDFSEIWKENKEDHQMIRKDLGDVANTLKNVELAIAKKF